MHFLQPWWLLLLVGVVLFGAVYAVLQLRRHRYVARFSNVELLGSVVPRRPGWRRHLTFALLLIALLVLSLGVAKPTRDKQVPLDNGVVMLNIDVSLSMEAVDVLPSRIDAARSAAKQFAELLPAKVDLGLVAFSGQADLDATPTLDRSLVIKQIDALKPEASTAIGEAIFTSLQAIQVFIKSTTPAGQKAPPASIVLMSDGTNTVGRSVESAIASAKQAHVPVSTIAFGTPNGTVTINGQVQPVPADDGQLQSIAQQTGGSFHTAHSEEELRSVYKNINAEIGHRTVHVDNSWIFLLIGVLFLFAAGGVALLWAGRLA